MTRRAHRAWMYQMTIPLLGLAGVAFAGDARADSATAEKLFREAKSLMSQKRYTEACTKLAESQRADPSGGTILHLALCHKEEGRIATAYQELQEAVAFAVRDKREDREKAAKTLMAELEPRLSKLTIAVTPDAMRLTGIEVKRDGVLVAPSDWGSALPTDPGAHTVTAWAPGRKPLFKTVDLRGDAATASVLIPDLEIDPAGKRPEDTPAALAAGTKRDSSSKDGGGGFGTQRKIAVVVGGVGVAALAVGTVFGVQAASAKSDSEPHCNGNICDPDGIRIRSEGIASGNLSTAFFIGGGAAAAAGLVLFFTAPKGSREKENQAGVTSAGIGPAGVWAQGHW